MKKIVLFLLALPLLFVSCYDKNEIEYTGAGDLCGQWIVTDDVTHTEFILTTSNVASNSSNELYITDFSGGKAAFWSIQAKVNANVADLSFSKDSTINMVLLDEVVDNKDYNGDGLKNKIVPYDIKINVKAGKVSRNAVDMPSGVKSDMIYLELQFEDDSPAYSTYKLKGYRKTGFHEDDHFVLAW